MLDFIPILSLLIWLPMLGSALLLVVRSHDAQQEQRNARAVALWISSFVFVLSLVAWLTFVPDAAGMQFVERHTWIHSFNIEYYLGVDGLSLPLIMLTALLVPLCVLISWKSIQDNARQFYACLLALEGLVIGVFCALDFVLFYIFWEAMLIPMFLMIGVWGGENRIYATLKFFLYTFAGSLLMLAALLYLYSFSGGSFDMLALQTIDIPLHIQIWLWLALFAAFAVKVPMWPFHTWLPDAHVQAPTAGSVILAGVLLKMGAYGFLRLSLPILPDASLYFAPLMFTLSAIAVVWAALVAFAQSDIKKMIAYSSVSHMGFVTLGIFAGTPDATNGAILQMMNHGIVSAALFLLIGVIYERMHTRSLTYFGGIIHSMPAYAVVFMIFTLASVGLPGTNSFVGEFLVLAGGMQSSLAGVQTATVVALSGVVLGALYMFWLYRKMIFGQDRSPAVRNLSDLTTRERLIFVPLILLVFIIGFFPHVLLGTIRPATQGILDNYNFVQQEPLKLVSQEASLVKHNIKEGEH